MCINDAESTAPGPEGWRELITQAADPTMAPDLSSKLIDYQSLGPIYGPEDVVKNTHP